MRPTGPGADADVSFFSLPSGRAGVLARILISGGVVFLAMVVVKNGWVLRESGLIGTCSVYATARTGAQQEKCISGRLDGRPSLAGKGCTVQMTAGKMQYWLCPAPLNSAPGGV
jgi:hypothetical protein